MWETFLNILAIVGVVVVGAIIVYLISYLAINGLNKGSSSIDAGLAKRGKKDKVIRPTVLDTNELDDNFEVQKKEEKSEIKSEKFEPSPAPKMWDDELADKEKQKLVSNDKVSNNLFFAAKPQEPKKTEKDFDDFDDIFNEEPAKKTSDVNEKEIADLITKINIESVSEYNATKEDNKSAKIETLKPQLVTQAAAVPFEKKEEGPKASLIKSQDDFFDDFEDEDEDEEQSSETNEKFKEEDFEEDSEEEVNYEEEKLALEQERKEIAEEQAKIDAEKADLEAQKKYLEEEKKRLEELRAEQINTVSVNNMPSIYSAESLEQLQARLDLLNERLKENKKDLRENRREYGPLAKVKKTLEKDKAKLNRREAIVARQKVILYGVNNYIDIDEEKAKKLNEDLDLLDGLRLSVQHCEDVINSNKDRFPILEKTNKILRKVNAEIMSDIAEVEKVISEKEAKGDE